MAMKSAERHSSATAEQRAKIRLYGQETVPLPVRSDPRRRLASVVLGLTAAALFAISVPLALFLLADSHHVGIFEVLRIRGVSLIATLWIFQGIALAAVSVYGSMLVLRKKAEAGGAWISLGVMGILLSTLFAVLANTTGAVVGIVSGVLLLVAGLLDIL